MMHVDEAHAAMIERHLRLRTGERRGRLERGHGVAEKRFCRKVWWEVLGHFDDLHPEYEVLDWRGWSYFCDFVWKPKTVKLVVEIKGFGPHVRDMDRSKYCNELNRETFLAGMGFQVISFSYDDVQDRPELCITLLRLVLSRYQAAPEPVGLNQVAAREIIRLAFSLARPIRPVDVEAHLSVNHRSATRILQQLSQQGVLAPDAGKTGTRMVRYELQPQALQWLRLG